MDSGGLALILSIAVATFGCLYMVARRVNEWIYESGLGEKRLMLPPGDMGWPLIGNMWSFLRAFKSGEPDSFIAGFVKRWVFFFLCLFLICKSTSPIFLCAFVVLW